MPDLLFEPVVIDVLEEGGTDAPYAVRELTSLPHGLEPVELQDWLAQQRNTEPALPPELIQANIAAYEQAVAEYEGRGGAFDAALDEELLSLGSLLQQQGDHARAQQVFERALHVNRVNDGLFNMGQVPIIERIIDNHLARGDLLAADEQQEYLLYVQRKNYEGSGVDLLPALTRYAEWNLFAFGADLEPVASQALETESAAVEQPDNPTETIDFRTGRLINAHNVYQTLIAIVTKQFGSADNRVLNFERQLALTNYLYIANFGLESELMLGAPLTYGGYYSEFSGLEPGRPPLGFRQGRDSLERRVEYLAGRADVAAAEKAQAKLDLADWMLMFSKRVGSLDIYMEAWDDMVAAGTAADELAALFNPPYPTRIPTYLKHPYTRAALNVPEDLALKYKGYIDVEYKLSRFGVPSALKVLNKTESATPAIETTLLRMLRRAQYRPRITDGSVRDNETMQARFYFTY